MQVTPPSARCNWIRSLNPTAFVQSAAEERREKQLAQPTRGMDVTRGKILRSHTYPRQHMFQSKKARSNPAVTRKHAAQCSSGQRADQRSRQTAREEIRTQQKRSGNQKRGVKGREKKRRKSHAAKAKKRERERWRCSATEARPPTAPPR